MMKTLNKVLHTLLKSKVDAVKIGCKGGSGLWYCAKLTTKSFTEIEHENKKINAREEKEMKKCQNKFDNLDQLYEDAINRWLTNPRNVKKSETKKTQFINSQMKAKERARKSLPNRIEKIKKDLESPFLDRQVVEVVDSISPDEPNTKIIYIKGYESGNYWTIKEFTKDHLPLEKQLTYNVRLPRLGESKNG